MNPERTVIAWMRTVLLAGSLLIPLSPWAAILVIPSTPLSNQSVVIRLTNQYLSDASIAAAVITRSGNQFTISQTVNVACFLPAAPILTSDFTVGVLEPGAYQIVAQIQNVGVLPGCISNAVMETASFSVGDPVAVPVGGPWIYTIIAAMLLASAAHRLRRSRGKR